MMLQTLFSGDFSRATCPGGLLQATTWTLSPKADSSRNSGTESQPFICPAMPQKTHVGIVDRPEFYPQILRKRPPQAFWTGRVAWRGGFLPLHPFLWRLPSHESTSGSSSLGPVATADRGD